MRQPFLFKNVMQLRLYDKLNPSCILIDSDLWSTGRQTHRWRHHSQNFAFLSYEKKNGIHVAVGLYSKRSQKKSKVVRTSVTHLAAACVLLFCSYHILTIDIFYWTDAQQHSIHLLNCQMIEMIVLFHNAIRQICSIIVPDFYGSFAIRQHPLTWQHILAMPA